MRKWLVEVVFPSEEHREVSDDEKQIRDIDALFAYEVSAYEKSVYDLKKKEDVLQPLCKGIGSGENREEAIKNAENNAVASLPNVFVISKYVENIYPGEVLEKAQIDWLKGELKRREENYGLEDGSLVGLIEIFGVAYVTNIMGKNLLWATDRKFNNDVEKIRKLNTCIVASQRGVLLD